MLDRLEDFIRDLQAAPDAPSVSALIEREITGLGFDRFAYLVLHAPDSPHEPIYFGSYPEGWTEHYVANDYVNIDPVMPAASRTLTPFTWESLQRTLPANGPQRRMIAEASEFGLRCGITVPVHGPGRGLATLNVAARVPPDGFRARWPEFRHALHLIAIYSHEAVLERTLASAGRKLPQLAPRERECLLWSARGKTAWEVATILNLSQETVVHYLKSAASKLGVHNKTHAVVKAILLGLIVP